MTGNFIQQNRFLSIDTPLGADKLLLRSFSGTEAISNLFSFQLELLSEDHNIDVSQILGKRVTVTMDLPKQEGGQRFYNGFISRFQQLPDFSRFARYQAEMVPWAWFLTRTTDCKIFQKEAVPDIVEKVFRTFQFPDFERELQKAYLPWDYCVQYRENACHFIMRLLETEGIFFYFRHEQNRHVLVMADTPTAHKPLKSSKIKYEYLSGPGYAQQESGIDRWLIDHDLRTGRYAITDYNFETPSRNLLANVDSNISLGDNQAFEIFDFPGGYDTRDEGNKYVRLRMEEEEVEHATVKAEGNCRHFSPGYRFDLIGHHRRDQNQPYVITSVTHDASIGGNFPDNTSAEDEHYRNRFTCIPYSVPFRPGRHTPKPIVQGTQTAVVVGPKGEEIYTNKHGQVKIQFHWDRYGKRDENSSCWVRVSHPWAGKGWGAISIPRIGQEVIVDFIEGDPDLPIITGRVYNADVMPPFNLPGEAVVSGIKSNTHKGKGYNEISMNDTAGKEDFKLHAQYDMNSVIEHDDNHTVKTGNKTIKVETGTHTETIKGDTKITIVSGKHELRVDANSSKHSAKTDVDISSDTTHVFIDAATEIKLHVGASTIQMFADGKIKIDGVNVSINGSESVSIHGGSVRSTADSEHETKGAIVKSEGSATNTVKGGMVMLNP